MVEAVRTSLSLTIRIACILTCSQSDVFNQNSIVLASGASSTANGKVYLGRPWGAYAKYAPESASFLPVERGILLSIQGYFQKHLHHSPVEQGYLVGLEHWR